VLAKNTKFNSVSECYYRICGLSILRDEIWVTNQLLAYELWFIVKILSLIYFYNSPNNPECWCERKVNVSATICMTYFLPLHRETNFVSLGPLKRFYCPEHSNRRRHTKLTSTSHLLKPSSPPVRLHLSDDSRTADLSFDRLRRGHVPVSVKIGEKWRTVYLNGLIKL
jgi:hypothetical protein